jgi:FdhD protein
MPDEIVTVPILKITEESRAHIEDVVVRETPVTIIFNNQELVTLLCTPKDLNHLAVGFLASEGLLEKKTDIKQLSVDESRGVVRVETIEEITMANDLLFKRLITSGCGRGAAFYTAADVQKRTIVESRTRISPDEISALVREFQHHSELYRSTGGVHSAALCDSKNTLVFKEDIGRHNAVDKIFGECLLKEIATDGKIIVTSGRISSEILLKVSRRNIPIIISKSAPTDLGVRLANELGITLCGFARGKRVNVYTNDWRILPT